MFGTKGLVPHGYLAVDFFFMLSGFVLAHAYEDRLRGGLRARALMLRRLHRLYPMVALGVVAGLCSAYVAGTHWRMFVSDAVAGALLLPQPLGTNALGTLFPIDPPLWSLFWEVVASAIFAAVLYRSPTRLLMAAQMAAFAALVWCAMHYGTLEVGFEWRHFIGGAARIGFGFVTGLLLFRRWVGQPPTASVTMGALAAVLGLLLLMPVDMPTWLYDLLATSLAFPFLILAAAEVTQIAGPWRTGATLSYPLYVLHAPVLKLLQSWQATHPGLGAGSAVLLGLVLSSAAAWLGHRLWDTPVRRWLHAHSRFERRPTLPEHQPPPLAV